MPSPVSDDFQAMFSLSLQRTGSCGSLETPDAEGPRQSGHCSALGTAAHNANSAHAAVQILRIAPRLLTDLRA
jgi:hypothetical protein